MPALAGMVAESPPEFASMKGDEQQQIAIEMKAGIHPKGVGA